MATIGIDTRALFQPATGIGQYVRGFVSALPRTHSYRLWGAPVPGTRFDRTGFGGKKRFLAEAAWERGWPRPKLEAVAPPADLWHFPNYVAPPTAKPFVLTVCDLAYLKYPEYVQPRHLKFLRRHVPASIERAERVIAISESTKQGILEAFGLPEEKVTVTHLAAAPRFAKPVTAAARARARKKHRLPERYLLAVGTLEPRKNLKALLETFAKLDGAPDLVVVGGQGWLFDETEAALRKLHLSDRVRFTGYVPDADLPAIYAEADVFIFPSHYEGFGIPVLEAMNVGTPVLCSDSSSLPEVGGSAARYFDPADPNALRSSLETLLGDSKLRRKLAAAGKAQARRFSWKRTAAETAAVYDAILESST